MKHILKSISLVVALMWAFTALAATHSVTVSWTPPTTHQDGGPLTIDHYEIWRSSGNNTPSFFGDTAPAAATSFTLSGVIEGSTYNFQVRAISANGVNGALSAPVSIAVPIPESATPPNAPTNVTVVLN